MDNTAYIMASKQMSAIRHLEVLSNNVANVNTTGFKADNVLFKQFLHKDIHDKTAMTAPLGSMLDLSEGAVKATNRALDVAISGPGFFIVRTPLGDRYTRAGHFKINKEGVLITPQGHRVLSFDGQEITFEDGDVEPIIGENGTVFVGAAERGRIGVAEFDDYRKLRKLGNGLFTTSEDAKLSEDSIVAQGMLEESNVTSITEITLLAQIHKEVAETTHFINETYNMQRNAFKIYSRVGG